MKSNYDVLEKHIKLVDIRNRDRITDRVLGINIDKFFMPSVANVIGTDLSSYKLLSRGRFACNPMHVGRDERLPVALYNEDEPAIVSPAYFMFEIIDSNILNEEYLMMWFRRPEFDRICWLHTDGSVRGGITWEDMCRIKLPVPPINEQLELVASYKAITDRIELKRKINDNLEATAQAIYSDMVSQIPIEKTDSIYTVLSVINGSPFTSEYFNSDKRGLPLVRIRDLSMCNPDIYTDEVINKMEFVNAGDILIGMDGEFIPHIWYGLKGVLNQRVCKVVPNNEFIHPLFLYLTLKPILAEVQRTQGGTTVIHIGKKDFDRMTCVSLSTEEHHSFSKKVSPIFNIMLENYKEILSLCETESIIMSLLSR